MCVKSRPLHLYPSVCDMRVDALFFVTLGVICLYIAFTNITLCVTCVHVPYIHATV